MKSAWIVIAILSGAFLPIQAGLNTRLGKAAGSPVYASFISFLIGAASVLIYAMLTRQHLSWAGLRAAPAHVWIGGILGAFYVTAIILAFPKIGPALTFGLVVAGQMIIAVLLDQFKILVTQQHSINAWRVLGIAMIIAGVFLVRKF